MRAKVLTVTVNPSIDLASNASRVISDEKVRCTAPSIDAGGGGLNVARVLTRLEVASDALFVYGGYTGRLLKELLAEEAIRAIPIESMDVTRQNLSVIDEHTQEQYRFVMPGKISDAKVWQQILKEVEDRIAQYDFVVGSGSLPEGVPTNFYSQLGNIVRSAGKNFILDTGGASLLQGLASAAFCIKPNGEEFEQLKTYFQIEKDEALYQKLQELGVQHIIHTKGKSGTWLINKEGITSFTPPAIKVRSTVGAGDSFIGGMVAGIIKGFTMNQAVAYGISAAASTLQSEGTELCEFMEVETLFKKHFSHL